jgi:uncharacterized protein (TIGR03437 family)
MKHRYLEITLLLAVSPTLLAQVPIISTVTNPASRLEELSPGIQARVFGQNFSAAPDESCTPPSSGPVPTALSPCNGMVLIDGVAAPILVNSPSFMIFQFPLDEPEGKGAPSLSKEIVVDVAGVRSEPVSVELRRFAPSIFQVFFTEGTVGNFQRGNSQGLVSFENRAVPGETIDVLATGLGLTDPPIPTGFRGSGEPFVVQPKVLIHGAAEAVVEANVISAIANGLGLARVRIVLPADLPEPIDQGLLYGVEIVIEDGGEVFTSPQVNLPVVAAGDHVITGVLDAAGGQPLISPGSIVSVFGNFTESSATTSSVPLNENLGGFSVTFNGTPGALFGVFDGDFDQSNVQVPWNVDVSSGKVEVKVHWKDETTEVWSDPFEADAALASPGIYMHPPGTTQAIVTNFKQAGDDVISGSWSQPSGSIPGVDTQPAAIGGVATIWSNGLGPVSPVPETGDLPQPPGTSPVTDKIVRVFVGGIEAQVLGAVLQSLSVGLNQINIIIPVGVTPGNAVPIVIEVECPDGTKLRSREDATIAVRAAP